MSEVASPVQTGDVLAGKYQVERVLGVGGMGVVVAALHLELGQRVALKFLLPQALEHPEAAPRFLREARAAVKIQSEHVARVIDVGRLESGAPYMVMEYLEGQDLSDHPKGVNLPVEDAIDFVLQASEAMAVAHTVGIIHRDLKPANLFLARRPDGSPVVKVLDFGISKVTELDAGKAALTQTSAVMGSPLYMSPEQMKSARNVDVRTDIWSLGAILYELLTGEPPFMGETLGEVFAAVMTAQPVPPRQRRADIDERLERVVLHALEKDPARRFANVGELATALSELAPPRSRALVQQISGVLSRAGVTTSPAAVSVPHQQVSAPVAAATNTSWEDAPQIPVARSRTPLAIAVAVGVVFAGLGVGFALRGSPASAGSSMDARPSPGPAAVALSPGAPIAAQAAALEVAPVPVAPVVAVVPASAVPSVAPPPVVAPALAAPAARHTAKRGPEPAASHVAPAAAAVAPPAPPRSAPPSPAPAVAKKNPLSIDFK